MATSYIDNAEEDLTCPVCRELFVDPDHTPKELSCPHVCCKKCLLVMVKNINGERAIECPECRVVTKVPPKSRKSEGGVPAMKTSLRLQSLAEKHLTFSKAQATGGSAKTCPKHNGEKIHFYCVTCEETACPECFLSDHPQPEHCIKGVIDIHKEKILSMNDLISKCESKLSHYERQADLVGQLEENILTHVADEEKEIDNAIAEAIANAQEQGQLLKAKIRSMHDSQLSKYQNQQQKLKKTAHDAKRVKERSVSVEYIEQHKLLEDNLKETLNSLSDVEYADIPAEVQTFKMIKKLNTKKLSVKMQMFKMMPQIGMPVHVRQLELIDTFRKNEDVRGIAAGPAGILAVCSSRNVYSFQQTGQKKDEQILNLTKSMWHYVPGYDQTVHDVGVTTDGRYLVARKQVVELYNTSGDYVTTFHTTQDKNMEKVALTCITTTPDGKVIVGDYGRCVVTTHYEIDGRLIKTISTCFPPERIAVINSTEIAISNAKANKVCVIDLESEKETLSIDISSPQAICYDEETDCLLIGRDDRNPKAENAEDQDTNSLHVGKALSSWVEEQCSLTGGRDEGVIEQYSLSAGCLIAQIAIAEGLRHPCALTFTRFGMLAVADLSVGVKIYEIV